MDLSFDQHSVGTRLNSMSLKSIKTEKLKGFAPMSGTYQTASFLVFTYLKIQSVLSIICISFPIAKQDLQYIVMPLDLTVVTLKPNSDLVALKC
jgi:hypothetical protein